ncbi:MAG: nucleotidyltransferase domain-containing protein [Planctomycetaceae bacterium]|jgi:predicted nucleotidyltransferase|nr:nucleotidyltransferase domain-containing protein [Planctomycetaceae bacterium]
MNHNGNNNNNNNNNNNGLLIQDCEAILKIFAAHPEIERAILFGSRACGTFRRTSDIDFALEGAALTQRSLGNIGGDFEESTLPYKVDLLDLKTLQSPELREQISRYGVEFYRKMV